VIITRIYEIFGFKDMEFRRALSIYLQRGTMRDFQFIQFWRKSMNIKNRLIILAIMVVGSLSIAGCGKSGDKEPLTEAKTTVGTEIDDSVITTKVKSALLKDTGLESLDIKVETRRGEAQLSGFVDSQNQMDRAIAIAQEVKGVRNVDNKMNIKTRDTSVGTKVDDSIITTKVKTAFLSDPTIKSFDISVVTRDGEVQLSGFVENQTQIDRAIEVALEVEGVKNVLNEMSINE
jgi:hyperosmotically inducible protein